MKKKKCQKKLHKHIGQILWRVDIRTFEVKTITRNILIVETEHSQNCRKNLKLYSNVS